ncbi:unnamed protein product [Rotaria magnacalcarata]|uniref:Ubiquitin-like domain-containing protein n=1 Tax=Rotaria magnacalcarata TaxID=392030 RepID=A0A819G0N4_9BILA|nr:unnamed protein product [Rotaria magnacalcarata]CAF1602919.1 unnamed protein product [Rotaria magnacalcarata]CAF1923610.1 unnamed protein product [Rotaria magnacalcarata]CAF2009658.1 unnamed protein product [Rotaria magnacalcarata]CAF2075182.1 unnamed protein product [Rotaria magnacalcarata]
MQPTFSSANTNSDCYLQIRRGKQTIFTDVSETTTAGDLKRIIANILKINPEIIRLTCKGQLFDIDGKHLLEYGITTREARPQTPVQLELILQLDDGTYEVEEIVPYTADSSSRSDESQQMGSPIDSK